MTLNVIGIEKRKSEIESYTIECIFALFALRYRRNIYANDNACEVIYYLSLMRNTLLIIDVKFKPNKIVNIWWNRKKFKKRIIKVIMDFLYTRI